MNNSVLTPAVLTEFRAEVISFYQQNGRHALPWRIPEDDGTFDPYKIFVSEIMLQQTQVTRVIEKYRAFLKVFPSVEVLAEASLAEVLQQWSGLGYYRRAKFLHQSAQLIVLDHNGKFPESERELVLLPGVGKNTAAAICAYSYNMPVVFIETNIRSVFIHHFFINNDTVADKDILVYVEATLDKTNSRQWYWALMDYGSYLKTITKNPNHKSKHYTKQSTFTGSVRQIRGAVLRLLVEAPQTQSAIEAVISDTRLLNVLKQLEGEGLISKNGHRYYLGK